MSRESSKNFEINLMPVLALLAVLVSFLLLTVVWIHVGALEATQGFGQTSTQSDDAPHLLAILKNNGEVELNIKTFGQKNTLGSSLYVISPTSNQQAVLKGKLPSAVDWSGFGNTVSRVLEGYPDLKVATVIPGPKVKYDQVVSAMEILNGKGISSLSVAPL